MVILASRFEPLKKEKGWHKNANGKRYHHKFGFGLLDAGQMTSLAKSWTTVDPMVTCSTNTFKKTQ